MHNKIKNLQEIEITGETYLFSNKIGDNPKLIHSFNSLLYDTFQMTLDSIGGYYEPHVLVKDGEICANVSVNQMPFFYQGRKVLLIQLGTVMTRKNDCGKGLSRWLIQYVLNRWQGKCDGIYLFANDSVLDFYPRFGFEQRKQIQHCITGVHGGKVRAKRLQMDNPAHVELAWKKYSQGNPFSKLCMMENDIIFSFYIRGMMKDSIYYSKSYDVLIFAEEIDGYWWCYDIFGDTHAELNDILEEIPEETVKDIWLGFTPNVNNKMKCIVYDENDTTLFVHSENRLQIFEDEIMFPIISYA